MVIRTATPDDAVSINRLIASLASCFMDNSQDVLPGWFLDTITTASIVERIKDPAYLIYVDVEDDGLVGYIAIKDNSHLYHLFVREDHQGKGIARELWSAAKGACNAACYTVRSSLNAVPVYKKLGFMATGPVETKAGISYQAMEYSSA